MDTCLAGVHSSGRSGQEGCLAFRRSVLQSASRLFSVFTWVAQRSSASRNAGNDASGSGATAAGRGTNIPEESAWERFDREFAEREQQMQEDEELRERQIEEEKLRKEREKQRAAEQREELDLKCWSEIEEEDARVAEEEAAREQERRLEELGIKPGGPGGAIDGSDLASLKSLNLRGGALKAALDGGIVGTTLEEVLRNLSPRSALRFEKRRFYSQNFHPLERFLLRFMSVYGDVFRDELLANVNEANLSESGNDDNFTVLSHGQWDDSHFALLKSQFKSTYEISDCLALEALQCFLQHFPEEVVLPEQNDKKKARSDEKNPQSRGRDRFSRGRNRIRQSRSRRAKRRRSGSTASSARSRSPSVRSASTAESLSYEEMMEQMQRAMLKRYEIENDESDGDRTPRTPRASGGDSDGSGEPEVESTAVQREKMRRKRRREEKKLKKKNGESDGATGNDHRRNSDNIDKVDQNKNAESADRVYIKSCRASFLKSRTIANTLNDEHVPFALASDDEQASRSTAIEAIVYEANRKRKKQQRRVLRRRRNNTAFSSTNTRSRTNSVNSVNSTSSDSADFSDSVYSDSSDEDSDTDWGETEDFDSENHDLADDWNRVHGRCGSWLPELQKLIEKQCECREAKREWERVDGRRKNGTSGTADIMSTSTAHNTTAADIDANADPRIFDLDSALDLGSIRTELELQETLTTECHPTICSHQVEAAMRHRLEQKLISDFALFRFIVQELLVNVVYFEKEMISVLEAEERNSLSPSSGPAGRKSALSVPRLSTMSRRPGTQKLGSHISEAFGESPTDIVAGTPFSFSTFPIRFIFGLDELPALGVASARSLFHSAAFRHTERGRALMLGNPSREIMPTGIAEFNSHILGNQLSRTPGSPVGRKESLPTGGCETADALFGTSPDSAPLARTVSGSNHASGVPGSGVSADGIPDAHVSPSDLVTKMTTEPFWKFVFGALTWADAKGLKLCYWALSAEECASHDYLHPKLVAANAAVPNDTNSPMKVLVEEETGSPVDNMKYEEGKHSAGPESRREETGGESANPAAADVGDVGGTASVEPPLPRIPRPPSRGSGTSPSVGSRSLSRSPSLGSRRISETSTPNLARGTANNSAVPPISNTVMAKSVPSIVSFGMADESELTTSIGRPMSMNLMYSVIDGSRFCTNESSRNESEKERLLRLVCWQRKVFENLKSRVNQIPRFSLPQIIDREYLNKFLAMGSRKAQISSNPAAEYNRNNNLAAPSHLAATALFRLCAAALDEVLRRLTQQFGVRSLQKAKTAAAKHVFDAQHPDVVSQLDETLFWYAVQGKYWEQVGQLVKIKHFEKQVGLLKLFGMSGRVEEGKLGNGVDSVEQNPEISEISKTPGTNVTAATDSGTLSFAEWGKLGKQKGEQTEQTDGAERGNSSQQPQTSEQTKSLTTWKKNLWHPYYSVPEGKRTWSNANLIRAWAYLELSKVYDLSEIEAEARGMNGAGIMNYHGTLYPAREGIHASSPHNSSPGEKSNADAADESYEASSPRQPSAPSPQEERTEVVPLSSGPLFSPDSTSNSNSVSPGERKHGQQDKANLFSVSQESSPDVSGSPTSPSRSAETPGSPDAVADPFAFSGWHTKKGSGTPVASSTAVTTDPTSAPTAPARATSVAHIDTNLKSPITSGKTPRTNSFFSNSRFPLEQPAKTFAVLLQKNIFRLLSLKRLHLAAALLLLMHRAQKQVKEEIEAKYSKGRKLENMGMLMKEQIQGDGTVARVPLSPRNAYGKWATETNDGRRDMGTASLEDALDASATNLDTATPSIKATGRRTANLISTSFASAPPAAEPVAPSPFSARKDSFSASPSNKFGLGSPTPTRVHGVDPSDGNSPVSSHFFISRHLRDALDILGRRLGDKDLVHLTRRLSL